METSNRTPSYTILNFMNLNSENEASVLRSLYRKLSLQFHPDQAKGNEKKDAAIIMEFLNNYFKTITESDEIYDRYKKSPFTCDKEFGAEINKFTTIQQTLLNAIKQIHQKASSQTGRNNSIGKLVFTTVPNPGFLIFDVNDKSIDNFVFAVQKHEKSAWVLYQDNKKPAFLAEDQMKDYLKKQPQDKIQLVVQINSTSNKITGYSITNINLVIDDLLRSSQIKDKEKEKFRTDPPITGLEKLVNYLIKGNNEIKKQNKKQFLFSKNAKPNIYNFVETSPICKLISLDSKKGVTAPKFFPISPVLSVKEIKNFGLV